MALDFTQDQLQHPTYDNIDQIDNGSLVIMGIKTDQNLANQGATISIQALKQIAGTLGLQGIQGPAGPQGEPGQGGGGGDINYENLIEALFGEYGGVMWEKIQKMFADRGFNFTVNISTPGRGSLSVNDGFFQQ